MGLTLSAADAVLKEDYHGPVVEQLNNGNILLAETERNTEDIVGRRFITPIHVGRNSGIGARAELATLPAAGNQQHVDIIGPVRSMYARIQVTGQVIEAMAKDRGAFIRALDSEMEGAVNDAKRDYCRQLWGESNGRLAYCGTTTASTTVQLVTSGATATRDDQLRTLEEGFLIDIGTLANPIAIAQARSVSSVDYTNKTFVISGAAVTTSTAHFVFRSGAGGASNNSGNPGDGQVELTGIQTMVDDTAVLHTVNPSSQPKWKSRVNSNSGTLRSISENLVTQEMMRAEMASGMSVDLLIGGDGVFRAYSNLLTSLKRFVNEVDLQAGYTGVTVGTPGQRGKKGRQTALTWDRDCPSNRLYGLNTSDFVFMELLDWQWMDRAGAVLVQVTDTDAYTATLKKYGDFVLKRRNAQFVIKDISES